VRCGRNGRTSPGRLAPFPLVPCEYRVLVVTKLLRELSLLLEQRALRVDASDSDYASIDLAAHLFAAATYLRQHHAHAAMDAEPLNPAIDLEEGLELAKAIPSTSFVDAYLRMCEALFGIDRSFDDARSVTRSVLPAQTALQPLHDGARPALFGTVQHWIRPRSDWRDARVYREEVMPSVNTYPPTPADRLEALGMVWDRGESLEVVPVRQHDLPHRPGQFRIALCPLLCGAHPCFTVNSKGNQFTIDRMQAYSDPGALQRYLEALAPHLEASQIQLLVLPELSITEEARTQLFQMLQVSQCMVGIVAGSFHVWRDDDPAPHNEAVFYVPGKTVWSHHKFGIFKVSDDHVRNLKTFFPALPPDLLLEPWIYEGIHRGNALQFWDTQIGRIAIVICADAIAYESMIPAVERIRPDVLLLPSLSMKTDEFDQLGERLARLGISVFYVNAGCVCEVQPAAHAVLVHIALPTPNDAPPSRVSWKIGTSPQVRTFRGAWRAAPPDHVLGNNDGLVVDLALHLGWRREKR
jgi:Carbon-nitrogen hydrolase